MFKKEENTNFKEAETIIGPSVKVEGDFVGQGNVIIDGVIKGSITTNGNLRVGDQAKINASVAAANALIGGEVRGNVTIKGDLELTENAKIFGDIEVKSICVARGAILNGRCVMGNNESKDERKQASEETENETQI